MQRRGVSYTSILFEGTHMHGIDPELIGRLADFHFGGMLTAIVSEANCRSRYFLSIE
jgi:hypothetical protein